MRFTFKAAPNDAGAQLPIIEEIPDHPLVWLEGRNAIGKSLAVRFLELATGGRPYLNNQAAWETLPGSLGRVKIVAQGASSKFEFELFPERWDRQAAAQSWERLGTARVNGATSSLDEVRARLRVHRIAGEEGLSRALGREFQTQAEGVRQFAAAIAGDQGTASDLLDEAITLIDRADPRHLAAAEKIVESLRESSIRLSEERSPIEERIAAVRAAVNAKASLESLRGRGPDLLRQISEFEEQLKEASVRRERAVTSLTQLANKADKEAELTKKLEQIESLISRREKAAVKARDEVMDLAHRAGMTSSPDGVRSRLDEIAGEIKDAAARRSELARSDAVRVIVTRLGDVLDDVPGLTDATTLFDLNGGPVDRASFSAALDLRRRELDETGVAQEVDALDRRLLGLGEERELLTTLDSAIDVLVHKREMVVEALDQFEELGKSLESGAVKKLKEARTQLNEAHADSERLTVELIEARHAYALLAGGATELELEGRIAAAVGASSSADLDGESDTLEKRREQLSRELDSLSREAHAAEQSSASIRLEAAVAVQTMVGQAEWGWLRASLPIDDIEKWLPSQFTTAQRVLSSSQQVVDGVVGQVGAVETALRDLGVHVSGEGELQPATPVSDAVIDICERRLTQQFGSPEISSALFDGERVDRVNLRQLVIFWEHEGQPMLRPLSAFSSGEQAFAYARALIEQIPPPGEGQHVLLVLDEFSAFIAGDRRVLLSRLLRERVKSGKVSQVVLIVPLTQDYETTALAATGKAGETLRRRADAVASVGYFAEPMLET